MRIILVADNASTRFGGEAFIPLNYFRLLQSRKVETWLVVHARNREELTKLFPQCLDRLFFVEDTFLHKSLFKLSTRLPRRLADATTGALIYFTTQRAQRRIIRNLVKQFGIDVVHQPTPVSPKIPSLIWKVGAPVVIGPLNGGMDYPPAFRRARGRTANLALAIGRWTADLFNSIIPGKRYADVILVANPRTREALPRGIIGRVIELVENGVDLTIWQYKPPARHHSGLRLIYVGRLIDWKAVEIVIEAIARVDREIMVSLEIVGDGPMREIWQALAEKRGLDAIVSFSGFLPQAACANRLRNADVFVLPSLFECGGAAVLEAMATGLPVIATAWGGPLDYLDESCGVLVNPRSKEALIAGFADAISKLANSSELRDRLGRSGYERAKQNFDWDRKIDRMLEIYAEALSRKAVSRR